MSNPVLRRILPVWFLCLVALLPFCLAQAADSNLQAIPELTSPVIDLTNTLSIGQQQALSQKLIALHDKYSAQMQVLIIPTSAPEDAFTYSMRVVDKWKLGAKGKDDGLLLFIAKDDHRSQLQVGYGLEGTIPDVIAHRLLNDVMAPYFKQGDFYSGINAVVDDAYKIISGDTTVLPEKSTRQSSSRQHSNDNLVFLLIIGFVIFRIIKALLGWLGSALIGGPLALVVAFWLGVPVATAFFWVFILMLVSLSNGARYDPGYSRGGIFGGGGFGGGWSGGGGGFGGGGSGGSW